MVKIYLTYRNLDRKQLERLDSLAGSLPGVSQVDVWNDRAEIVAADRSAAETCVDHLKRSGLPIAGYSVADGSLAGPIEIAVSGMTCRSCEILIEKKFGEVPGVSAVEADAVSGKAKVSFGNGPRPAPELFRTALAGTAYSIAGIDGGAAGEERSSWAEVVAYLVLAAVVGWIMSRTGLFASRATPAGQIGFWDALVIGLIAGISSCIAVSAGLLLSAAARWRQVNGNGQRSGLRPASSFVAGRLVSYGVLGGLIGWVGKILMPTPFVTGLLVAAAALFMLVAGLDMLKIAPRWLRRVLPALPKIIPRRLTDERRLPVMAAPFLLGAATFFLPCGFTQSLQVYALSTGSFISGSLALLGFAVGTAPALLALGWAAGPLAAKSRWRRPIMQGAGALVVVMGLMTFKSGAILMGLPVSFWSLVRQPAPGTVTSAAPDLPPVIDGRQIIRMTIGSENGAYDPDSFSVRAGVPVRWEIEQRTRSGCLAYVVSGSLGINAALSYGPNVVEFTPRTVGKHVFSCSMGMYTGIINVLPQQ